MALLQTVFGAVIIRCEYVVLAKMEPSPNKHTANILGFFALLAVLLFEIFLIYITSMSDAYFNKQFFFFLGTPALINLTIVAVVFFFKKRL